MQYTKWQRQLYHPCIPLGKNFSRITECEEHIQLSRQAAIEGTVLLKNENDILPLSKGTKLAIFGKAQIDYIKGGGGSGDTHVSYVRNIYQGLQLKEGQVEVFEPLSFYYQEYVEDKYRAGEKVGMFDEAPIPKELIEQAKRFTDTAVITICRYSQEDEDRYNDGSDCYFYLSAAEQKMVDTVAVNFKHIIVLLNTGAMIDTSWFANDDKIEAALLVWQGGMEGGLAVADVLTGDANPSGKLVDTCAQTFDDYPSSEGFHESKDYVRYSEDIFVGYRYFETIPGMKDRVVYPFGYGLSYTTFKLSKAQASSDKENIYVTLTVTNTGKRAGKEVIQVYYSAPLGVITKPTKELCGFAKTTLLKPGESQNITVTFAIRDMASYDDCGDIEKSCYILEKGTYRFYVGTSIRNVQELQFVYQLDRNVIVERLHAYCVPKHLEKRMMADGSYRSVKSEDVEKVSFVCDYHLSDAPQVEKPYQLLDVAEGKVNLDTFLAQMTDEEMCELVGGHNEPSVSGTSGIGLNQRLGVPLAMTADGPAGLRCRKKTGITTTAFPIATALACSWNLELMEEIGKSGALEAKENNISIWLTPAMNIHRSPLCGRNFEYFSEDPFLAGKMAAAKVRGIQTQHIVATPKHFACNNKETNRFFSDSILSERALREIYLKGFEICVKESKPKMIMTSYNLINGVPTSQDAELLQGILRNEWGYEGMLTTDWGNQKDHVKEVIAGNDVKMSRGESEKLMEALQNGNLKREELALCVRRILEMMLWLE